jgi:glycerol-3-phosphate dehydrogenase
VKRDLAEFEARDFDVAVIGGGIAGAFVAWDAALRGLSVALLEAGDFGHATSAHSLKIVHGGIRYLQHADVARVRESCRERSALLRIAPHLVRPLPVVIPTYGHGRSGKAILAAAFRVLGVVTADRNRGIADPDRRIPGGRTVSREECLRWFPDVETHRLTGAGMFWDAQLVNPPRLVLAVVRSAAELGAVVANYVEVAGLLRHGGRIAGVRARNVETGATFDVRARAVVNAAGPFAEAILVRAGVRERRQVPLSRDMAIVTRKPLVRERALAVQTRYRDPDAILSRGNRHLFAVPWREFTLVGVNSRVHAGDPYDVPLTEAEVAGFVQEINEANPRFALRLEDVSQLLWGLLPFGANTPGAKDLSFGKRSILVDHGREDGIPGLITAMSVRFTTGRAVAERAVDLVFRCLGRTPPACRTRVTPVHGGGLHGVASAVAEARAALGALAEPGVAEDFVASHGSGWRHVAAHVERNPALGQRLDGSTVLEAEVVHAVREEMARTLADVVLRRTGLGTGAWPGAAALERCAAQMAAEVGWDPRRVEAEIAALRGSFPPWSLP